MIVSWGNTESRQIATLEETAISLCFPISNRRVSILTCLWSNFRLRGFNVANHYHLADNVSIIIGNLYKSVYILSVCRLVKLGNMFYKQAKTH